MTQARSGEPNEGSRFSGAANGPPAPGMVWQDWAMGGGEWVTPKTVRLSDEDVERIAAAVVRAMKEDRVLRAMKKDREAGTPQGV
jgi:hypothetical protein